MHKKSTRQLIFSLTFTLMALFVLGALTVFAQGEGRIAGIVYVDTNGNSVRDEGEEGYQDAEITFSSSGWDTTINTDATGAFSIALNPATYTVTLKVPEGYTAAKTETEVFIEQAGDEVSNLEFPIVPITDGDGDILPESGGIVSGGVILGGLLAILGLGIALVLVGQRLAKK